MATGRYVSIQRTTLLDMLLCLRRYWLSMIMVADELSHTLCAKAKVPKLWNHFSIILRIGGCYFLPCFLCLLLQMSFRRTKGFNVGRCYLILECLLEIFRRQPYSSVAMLLARSQKLGEKLINYRRCREPKENEMQFICFDPVSLLTIIVGQPNANIFRCFFYYYSETTREAFDRRLMMVRKLFEE
jgi:hypothetical protein